MLRAVGAAIAYLRRRGSDAFVVAANAGSDGVLWELDLPVDASGAVVVPLRGAGGGEYRAEVDGRALRVALPGRAGMVVRLDLA